MSFNGWGESTLGEVAIVTKLAGFEFTKHIKYTDDGEIIAIRAVNVKNGVFDLTDIKRIEKTVSDSLARSKLFKNDIVLTYTGANFGETAIVKKNNMYHLAPNVAKVTINSEYDPYFFFSYFRSTKFREQLKNYGVGSSQPTIPMKIIRELSVPVPPLKEQIAISSIIANLDDKIELNNRMNKVLEQMAQAIFKQWFVDFEFPNENGEPYKSSGGGMEWCEELGKEIPKGWRIGCLADIAEILMGQSPKSEFYNTTGEGLPFHQGVANYGYRYPIHNVFCSHLLRVARKGSILMSVRAPVGRLNIADRDIVIGRGLCAITPKHNYYSYLFALLQTVFAVEDRYGSGTIFNSISKKELENIKIIIPTMELMRLFDEVASSYDSKISNNCNQISLLSQTRDTLLPKLMSGEIDVSEVEL